MSSYKYILRLAMFTSVLLAVLMLAACGSADDGAYTVISPTVNPGETLSGDDFIMVSAFSDASYTATLETAAPTSEPGLHEVTVTVTDGHGFERAHTCSYTVRSFLRDSVRIEAGEPITVNKFINTDISTYREFTYEFENVLAVADYGIGTHRVGVFVDGVLYYSSLILEDTIPPTATPVTVHIVNSADMPRAEDFVANIKDATSVACKFKESYDFNTTNDVYVTIILTDEAGNQTEVTSYATCDVDTTKPVISGVREITVYVGGSVKYMEGITVTDDSGETPKVRVDNSRVNLNEVGSYEITYSATDSSGNTTVEHTTVHVIEKPKIPEDEMRALAEKIYKEKIVTSDNMSKREIAYAIYTWTHDNIKYSSDFVDKNDPIGAAYDGMSTGSGDYFTYMVVSRELLGLAGIECRQITRLQYDGDAPHCWLLVDIGDGWYHFDSSWHLTDKPFESFMRTDAELEAYCNKYNIEYYYRFDKSKYPARGTVSYYDTETSESDTNTSGS